MQIPLVESRLALSYSSWFSDLGFAFFVRWLRSAHFLILGGNTMKKLLIMLFCIIATLTLAACEKQPCSHRDADDNSLCDNCDESYADGKDIEADPCQHRDTDDNTLCDNCGESYTDGKDVEDVPCQHRDSDDNALCDKCGESYSDDIDSAEHTHEYIQQNTDIKYLVTAADCKNAAMYYHSCSCGEIGETTFTYGDTTGHNHNVKNTNANYLATAADCKHAATYYYSCVCGNKGVTTFTSGTKTEHIPKEAVKENIVESTCTTDGKYDSVLYCKTCPLELSREVKIIPKEHKFVNDECKFCGNLKSSDGLSFSLNPDEKSYTVVGIGSFKGTHLIVDTYNNLPVTSIASRAFQYCDKLTSVIIGKNVTSIDYEAFKGCSSLENISIPFVGSSSTNPGINAHFGYIFGTSHSSNSGSSGYHYSYMGNYGMSYVTYNIPTTLKTVIITGESSIDAKVFHGCTTLTSITISSNITLIGDNAFRGCTKIKSITLPDGVESIGENAFRECESLQNVIIPDSVTSIGLNAFYGCPIKNVQIPSCAISSINTASNYLESVIITSGDSIGQYSFYNCPKLKTVTISSSVKNIGAYAFAYCKNLTSVVFENPNGWWYSSNSSAANGTSIASNILSNASTAAEYIKTTYSEYYWKRS